MLTQSDEAAHARESLESLLSAARAAGAEAADARIVLAQSGGVTVRMGRLETVERDESASASLRVLIGARQANVGSSDLSPGALQELARRAVAMARLAPEDPYCGLAEPQSVPEIDLALDDGVEPDAAALETAARRMEDAALAVAGVTNSGGAGANWGRSAVWVGATNGFRGAIGSSMHSLGLSVIAEADGAMERDHDSHSRRFALDLPTPETVGRIAAERAVKRLGARKIDSRRAPVLFEPRAARALLGAWLGAMSGAAVARGGSFLRDRLGQTLLPAGIDILDDPLERRGAGSRPFDGEGMPASPRKMIENGVLTHYFLNWPAARQLGLASTGHAGFGFGDPPGIASSNVRLSAGGRSPGELLRDAGEGLIVAEMFGPAFNINNGDYSVGVAGFWFESGAPAFPVSEITVAGNLLEMFSRVIVANDLRFERAVEAPSLLIDALTIAGR